MVAVAALTLGMAVVRFGSVALRIVSGTVALRAKKIFIVSAVVVAPDVATIPKDSPPVPTLGAPP